MKSLLAVAALLAGLAAPALAEEATIAPPPPPSSLSEAALESSQQGAAPAVLPQSTVEDVVPMSAPLDANGPPPARSGCHHEKSTVYLTN